MTGCPAFYNLNYLNSTKCEKNTIEKICISDNADEYNTPCLIRLLEFLRKNFSTIKMEFIIHRDIRKTVQRLIDIGFFDKLNISVICIAGTDDFSCYDDCSLHIGFRVHAHIYNLSRRNLSILINEDMRGYGINITLGDRKCLCVGESIYAKASKTITEFIFKFRFI